MSWRRLICAACIESAATEESVVRFSHRFAFQQAAKSKCESRGRTGFLPSTVFDKTFVVKYYVLRMSFCVGQAGGAPFYIEKPFQLSNMFPAKVHAVCMWHQLRRDDRTLHAKS